MAEEKTAKPTTEGRDPFVWPDLPFLELMCAVVVTIVLILWSLGMDAPLGEIATPSRTENPAKAPWYFIGLQELLVYFDPWYAGVVLPTIIIVGLMAIPYLDHNPKGVGEYTFSARRFAMINFLVGYGLWMGLIVVGEFMRGPSWFFFWPWEPWDDSVHPAATALINFPLPAGILSLGAYFTLGYLLPVLRKWPVAQKLDRPRYALLMTLLLLMYLVPIKIVLRQIFHIRYILSTPWFGI